MVFVTLYDNLKVAKNNIIVGEHENKGFGFIWDYSSCQSIFREGKHMYCIYIYIYSIYIYKQWLYQVLAPSDGLVRTNLWDLAVNRHPINPRLRRDLVVVATSNKARGRWRDVQHIALGVLDDIYSGTLVILIKLWLSHLNTHDMQIHAE